MEKLAESVDEIKILEKTVNNLHEENNYLNKELLSIQNRTEKKSHEAIKLTEQLKAFYEKLANSSKENFNLNALLLKSQDSLDSLRLEKNRLAESFDNKID